MPSYHVVTPEGKVQKTRRQEVRALRWLPENVEVPLRHIGEAARKGLLALSIQVGLAVLQATMENEVAERVGPEGKHRPDRQAYRHGHEPGWAVIGGRKVRLQRPRVRGKGGGEIRLESYEWNGPSKKTASTRRCWPACCTGWRRGRMRPRWRTWARWMPSAPPRAGWASVSSGRWRRSSGST